MEIIEVKKNKKRFSDLLLIGDEDENMIDKYLHRGHLFALYDDDLKGVCVITREDEKTIEIKNIAIYPEFQNRGYGTKLLNFVFDIFKNSAEKFIVGTGENEKTLNFYKKNGFHISHRVKNFFVINYKKPIFENGTQLKDMIYLKKTSGL